MRMMRPGIAFATVVSALSTGCAPAYAQDEGAQACAGAAASVARRDHGEALRLAMRTLQSCNEEGVRQLAQIWVRTDLSSDEAYMLGGVSAKFNDRRLYLAALEAAEGEGRAPELRAAALRVLMRYAQPTRTVSLPDRTDVLHGGDVGVGIQTERPAAGGRGDLPASAALPQVRAVFQRRAQSDPDPWIRHIAAELEHLLDVPPPTP
jgi:hypothetical protein